MFLCLKNRFVINRFIKKNKTLIFFVLSSLLMTEIAIAKNKKTNCFMHAKTIFQTDVFYNPKIAVDVDAVIVHRHIHDSITLADAMKSWQDKYSCVGKMFFANSDGGNIYSAGKWDGIPHLDDIEVDAATNKLTGGRPYIVPTKGWTTYLEEMTIHSLEVDATAILPEEPLGHTYTGYSKSFKKSWEEYYKFPWMAENSSLLGRYLTGQLKSEQFLRLEEDLLKTVQQYNKKNNNNTAFVIPIHSLYGNIGASLSAPLGTTVGKKGIDGYIGQIWTGPVKWSLDSYFSDDKSFFCSAYALYDYFTQLTVGTDKKLWLLVDPVEDNPHHKWEKFTEWYKHCVVAMLLMSGIDSYEVMPWPDRIFLPGYEMGGGSPGPEDFRVRVLAITQVLQEIQKGGEWLNNNSAKPTEGIAVAVADSAMYERQEFPGLQGLYGLLMPLISRGIPVSSFVMERVQDKEYADLYKIIILSYENFKPVKPEMNVALAEWVKRGGTLMILGAEDDELDKADYFWWHKLGYNSPTEHLFSQLRKSKKAKEYWKCGKGDVIVNPISPREFANSEIAEKIYLPYLKWAVKKSKISGTLKTPGNFCMKRGDYIIAHSEKKKISLKGKFIDVFEINFPVIDEINLKPGESGLYKDISEILENGKVPAVLQATHRLISQEYKNGVLIFKVKGPAETPAVVRLFLAGIKTPKITAINSKGKKINVEIKKDKETYLLKFPNSPDGVTVKVT